MSKDHNNERAIEIEEKEATPSSLGREAKIGLAVIAVLVVVLIGGVVMRLMRSGEEEKPVATTAGDDVKKNAGHDRKTDANDLFPKEKPSKPKPFGSSSATVLSAKSASTKPSKPGRDDANPWKRRPSDDKSKSPSGTEPAAPPPFAIDPPTPSPDDRRHHHASESPRADSPVQRYGSSAEQNDSGGFSWADSGSSASDSRLNSRYGTAPASPPPPTPPAYSLDNDPSVPAMTVGQYDRGEYRREPPRRDHFGSRRNPSSLYGNTPVRREDGKFEVRPNDSYWTISESLYGTGVYFKALARHNQGSDTGDDQLKPGDLILAPEIAELEKSFPDLCPKASRREAMQTQSQSHTSTVGMRGSHRGGRTYTVAEGDTLFDIARYELGKASRWAEIYELNRDTLGKDFNYLTPGTQLVLPDGEKPDVIAEPPSNRYRR